MEMLNISPKSQRWKKVVNTSANYRCKTPPGKLRGEDEGDCFYYY